MNFFARFTFHGNDLFTEKAMTIPRLNQAQIDFALIGRSFTSETLELWSKSTDRRRMGALRAATWQSAAVKRDPVSRR